MRVEQLDRAGQMSAADDEPVLAIATSRTSCSARCSSKPAVRCGEAVSSIAFASTGRSRTRRCCASGWAATAADDYERAVVPWTLLAQREHRRAVQEAMLALPYAYGKLDVHGRAALLYANALESFGHEVERLDASLTSIRDGKFLKVLVREEVRQDKDWVIRLRSLPESPETYYLMELLASHDFQTALQNYLDLEDLRRKLASWDVQLRCVRRHDRFAPRRTTSRSCPASMRSFASSIRACACVSSSTSCSRSACRICSLRRGPTFSRPATSGLTANASAELATQPRRRHEPDGRRVAQRIARLQGVLTFTLRTEYHERLDVFARTLRELSEAIEVLSAQHVEFVRARQAAVHSFEGYDTPIARLRDARRRSARRGQPADGAARARARARRDRRARRAARAARDVPGPGSLRVGR